MSVAHHDLYCSTDELAHLVTEFEACTLARERWTHEAHLTVALWYLARHELAEATALIRDGIKRYNQVCGVAQTKTAAITRRSRCSTCASSNAIWRVRRWARRWRNS
jgi:hypothetical protein